MLSSACRRYRYRLRPPRRLDVPEGLFVQVVTPVVRPPRPGCAPNDVITSIDGKPATSNIELQELTLTKKPGDTVSIGYSRAGQSATTTVTLGAQP